MYIFELIVPELTDIGLIMYEISKVKLIVSNSIFDFEGGYFKYKEFIRSAEIVVAEYIFIGSKHSFVQNNNITMYFECLIWKIRNNYLAAVD
jgi:hypothetical protein